MKFIAFQALKKSSQDREKHITVLADCNNLYFVCHCNDNPKKKERKKKKLNYNGAKMAKISFAFFICILLYNTSTNYRFPNLIDKAI